jgi:hypothetical protein
MHNYDELPVAEVAAAHEHATAVAGELMLKTSGMWVKIGRNGLWSCMTGKA